ncbi:serine protease [Sphingorhabdus pulchriflava]|uniref:Serine protease n=1 Tax=Sphingorhabdus pulchriflava TaxID=2292257 RepID=A0A371BJE6_9SPHN|nr:serine protease [Sphingorhabdus pulchriflava]RDV07491.1 serine protease [Sphingorhabdus pulchriflava]
MRQLLNWFLVAAMAALAVSAVRADPSDIAAASRSVVRVVVFPASGGDTPIGHGSGIVVAPDKILTNAHVVSEEEYDGAIRVVIVPSDGGEAITAEIIDRSPRNDLALIALNDGKRLTPATFYSGPVGDGSDVFAIGYPGGVDIAQGLNMSDVLRPQAPVKTRGNVSAGRSAKEFETILHTAAIGGGNSGGPLVDACGRVLGVNSFGSISDGSDAEFFFAVAQREAVAFLRQNNVGIRSVDSECLSRADLSRAEAERAAAEKARIEEENRLAESARTKSFGEARRQAEYDIIESRDNRLMLTVILILLALGAAGTSWQLLERERRDHAKLAGGSAAALVVAAFLTWFTRPGFDEVDTRTRTTLSETADPAAPAKVARAGKMTCVIDRSRSRITVSDTADVPFEWTDTGCVNTRTQYVETNGLWTRTFVPNNEAQVSIISFEPDSSTYRIERHLLGAEAMQKAREARSQYDVKSCSTDPAMLEKVTSMNLAVRQLLPQQPNELLVFNCN